MHGTDFIKIGRPDMPDAHRTGTMAGRVNIVCLEDGHIAPFPGPVQKTAQGGWLGSGQDNFQELVTKSENPVLDPEGADTGIAEALTQAKEPGEPPGSLRRPGTHNKLAQSWKGHRTGFRALAHGYRKTLPAPRRQGKSGRHRQAGG